MRVSEIAKELGLQNKDVLTELERFGAYKKTASSGLTVEQVNHLRAHFNPTAPAPAGAPEPAPTPAAAVTDAPAPVEAPAEAAAPAAPAEPPVPEAPAEPEPPKPIILKGPVAVKDFAALLNLRPNKIIADLMAMNIFANINQVIDVKVAIEVGKRHGVTVQTEDKPKPPPPPPPPPPAPVVEAAPADKQAGANGLPVAGDANYEPKKPKPKVPKRRKDADDTEPVTEVKLRPPVVTILGHVDHGKTSLLDKIRNAKVAAGEAGGITQHIGAYTVKVNDREITFLDTPGHEAFTKMRARGANLTDIAVIVVAADEGIMVQTKEAIKHAKAANVTIMVAINKIDLPGANLDRVKQQLQNEGLQSEDWGGETICCPVSARTGAGIPEFLDLILLQSEVLELKAESGSPARGYVIEAQLETGKGPTANLLVKTGTLRTGDTVLCGPYWGRVKALLNENGEKVQTAEASHAVKLLGLPEVPEAGALFEVYPNEKQAREKSAAMLEQRRHATLSGNVVKRPTLDNFFAVVGTQEKKMLNLVLKTDVQGSMEALTQSLDGIKSDKVGIRYVLSGIGNISENDVLLASASEAIIIGFQVDVDGAADKSAKREGVEIRQYQIIYELIDDVRKAMAGLLSPVQKEKVVGHAEIRQIFKLNKAGNVAGCMVRDGRLSMRGRARLLRGREVVWSGKFASLRRFQSDASEVREGQECGVQLEKFNEINTGDVIECYEIESILPEL